MTIKVKYDEMKGLNSGEIAAKLRESGIGAELSTEEKQELIDFSQMDDTKQDEFIASRNDGDETSQDVDDVTSQADTELLDEAESQSTEEDLQDKLKPADQTSVEDETSQDDDSIKDDKTELLTNYAQSQEELRKQTDSARELGSKNKSLEQQLAESNAKIKEIEESKVVPPTPPPERPTRPKREDYDEGVYDPGYTKATAQYDMDFDKYQDNLTEYHKSNEPEHVRDLRKEIEALKEQTNTVFSKVQEDQQKTIKQKVVQEWAAMWDKAGEIQDTLDLKTSIDYKTINKYAHMVKNPVDGNENPVYSEAEVIEAGKFISALPAADIESYKKVTPILVELFNCDSGIPKKRHGNMADNFVIQSAIETNKLGIDPVKVDKFTEEQRIDALAKKQLENEKSVRATPVSQIGGNDKPLGHENLVDEKAQKLSEMSKTARRNIGILKKGNPAYDPKFEEEYLKLKAELTIK